jgi:outer membrane protein TolC
MKNLIPILIFFTQGLLATTFTPTDLANLASERAPLIRMQLENKAAATSQISQSRLYANPVFTLQSGSLKTGTQSGSVVDVTINQPIPWPGKRYAEINSAKILDKIADVDLQESKLLVQNATTLLGLEFAVLKELEKHNKERKHRFSVISRYFATRPLPSPKQKVEKSMIETQIKLVESFMFDLETKKKSILKQLEYLSGESNPEINVAWGAIIPPPAKESLLPLLDNNPDYQRSKKREELAVNRIEQAKYLAKPDIVVGANYRQENVAPVNHFYHANLSVVIPIIDRGQHATETARANARREEANTKLTMLDAELTLDREYQVLLSAHKSAELFPVKELKKIERQFEDAEDAFKKGRIDVTTFLQTDTQIHESIDLAYSSYLKYFTALSGVGILTGQKLEIK